jgi:hypothetical protein
MIAISMILAVVLAIQYLRDGTHDDLDASKSEQPKKFWSADPLCIRNAKPDRYSYKGQPKGSQSNPVDCATEEAPNYVS